MTRSASSTRRRSMKHSGVQKKGKRISVPEQGSNSSAQVSSSACGESTPYRCSKCHLIAVPPGHQLPLRDLPDASNLKGKPLWLRCPNEGPRELLLWDPEDPTRHHVRESFRAGRDWYRLCTPLVRLSSGAADGPIGPACTLRRMLGESFVQDRIAREGFSKRIDLSDLMHVFWGRHSSTDFPIALTENIGWRLLPVPLSEPRAWVEEASTWGVSLTREDQREILSLALNLLSAATPRAQEWSESRSATLDVPFDMRFSLEEQWAEKKELLQQVQEHLLSLCNREGVSKPDYEVMKRRFKCYVLRTYGALSSTQIAGLVYPNRKNGDESARKDLHFVRRVLKLDQERLGGD